MTKRGYVNKARGLWWVLDDEGYEVAYVGHPTLKEAVEALKLWRMETEKEECK